MDIDRRTVLSLAAGLATLAAVPTSARAATADRPDVRHGSRTGDGVALTFHGAGSPALAHRILAIAKDGSAHISVMAIGAWLDANPAMAGAVLDGGHDLGNHTMHHKPMRHLDAKQCQAEIADAAAVLTRITGNHGAWFRPSGTPTSNALIRKSARANGYPFCVSYDVDSLDYLDPKPQAIVANVMRAVRPGSIVSLHLGHPNTAKALPALLDALSAKKLRPVTLSALLKA